MDKINGHEYRKTRTFVRLHDIGPEERCEIEDLKRGDVFKVFEPDGTDLGTWRALGEANEDGEGVVGILCERLPEISSDRETEDTRGNLGKEQT